MLKPQLLISVLSLFLGLSASAFPLPKVNFSELSFDPMAAVGYDFEGIMALSNCSGSLIRFENSKDTDKALVFTNGHCLESGFAGPGEVVSHQASNRTFNVLGSTAQVLGRVQATEVVYSTMTNTDLTIYQLKETYAEIKTKFNVRPLTLSSEHPTSGMPIEVISGYWRKGYRCSVESFIPQLKEDAWTFVDSIRYSRPGCETIGGTSGSPIVLAGSRTMIGINNTGNEDGEKCTMNNPCEVDSNGQISYQQGLSYGQETFWVYSCLNSGNQLDLTLKDCKLPH
jgi:V8-like Glu-specific endopeptidase